MKGIRFQPAQLTVRVGEAVTFKNEDIVAHTVTADDGSFDSGLIQPGDTWKMTVQKDGTDCVPLPAASQHESDAGHRNRHKLFGKRQTQGGLPGFNPPRAPQELHPILVNFTAALLPLAFLSDLLGKWLKRSSLHSAGAWMVLYAAVITPLTAAAGWWWKSKAAGGLPPEVIAVHQWLGTALALIFIVLAIWRWRIYKRNIAPSWGYMGFALLVVLALVYQGSLGGLMAFGH